MTSVANRCAEKWSVGPTECWREPAFLSIMTAMSIARRLKISADLLCLGAFAAVVLAFWGDCIFGDQVPVAGVYQQQFAPYNTDGASPLERQWDSLLWNGVAQFYPWRELVHRSMVKHGELPLWNPHQFCGAPFVGNGQSGLFYPPHWLLAWFETGRAMGLQNALHYYLAGLFTILLIRNSLYLVKLSSVIDEIICQLQHGIFAFTDCLAIVQ